MNPKLTRYGAYKVEVYLVDPDTGQRQRVRRPFLWEKTRPDRPWRHITPDWSTWYVALRRLDRQTERVHV